MGGVDTDEWGRTSMPGLLAAGEVACTGVHGANRLASNSLLEGLVFGARAAAAMQDAPAAAMTSAGRRPSADTSVPEPHATQRPLTTTEVRDLMWKSVGLFRTRQGLETAVEKLETSYAAHRDALATAPEDDADAWKQFNLVTVARLIARAALRRQESRGAHYRDDFPKRDDLHWKAHIVDDISRYGEKRQN
jgi:L-aspartate oxidase